MTGDIHPHWDASADHADAASNVRRIPVYPAQHASIAKIMPRRFASRRPAALVGIFLALTFGFVASGGFGSLQSQILPGSGSVSGGSSSSIATVEIHITPTGVQPANALVMPGQDIIWFNDQSFPHILTSDGLKDASGHTLNSPALFPNMKYRFSVSSMQALGTFPYISQTSKDVTGTITVTRTASSSQAGAGSVPISTQSQIPQTIPSPATQTQPSISNLGQNGYAQNSFASSTPSQEALIPHNPYAIGSNQTQPLDQYGQPIRNINAPSTPHPNSQPSSGPEVWIVIVLSIAGVYVATRRMFVQR